MRSPGTSWIPGCSETPDAQIFDLEKLVEPVLGPFPPEAGLLDAAKRRHLRRDQAGVDADNAVFERLGDAPDAADVAAVEVRGEAELGIVREGDRLLLGLEPEE